jgi:hypothetical protein
MQRENVCERARDHNFGHVLVSGHPVVTLQILVPQPDVISEGECTVYSGDFCEYIPRDFPAAHALSLQPGLVHAHVHVPT